MRTIIAILDVEKRKKLLGGEYVVTIAKLDDGSISSGYGEFKVGDKVVHFFHSKYDKDKMMKVKY